jgi:D-beta-D-heptose 7-phosphate kinase/D-beta-D-heptose 1-phosphate adenosyltransferase
VIATIAFALSGGASLADSARLANQAAGIVVGKLGTAAVDPEELLASLSDGSGARR